MSESLRNANNNGEPFNVSIKVDTAGLGRSLGVEMVIYLEVDGETRFVGAVPFKVAAEDGDVITYTLKHDVTYSGVFRFAFRIYPWDKRLPHRQDFAYLKWV